MPTIVKGLAWAVVIAVAVVVLFLWVFPWVEGLQQDPTMAAAQPASGQAIRSPR